MFYASIQVLKVKLFHFCYYYLKAKFWKSSQLSQTNTYFRISIVSLCGRTLTRVEECVSSQFNDFISDQWFLILYNHKTSLSIQLNISHCDKNMQNLISSKLNILTTYYYFCFTLSLSLSFITQPLCHQLLHYFL